MKKEKHLKYQLIYSVIKNLIVNGDFPDNWLLPSTRDLANELKISRSTIVKSYEMLQMEKLISSKQGAGCAVTNSKELSQNQATFIYQAENYAPISKRGTSFLENRLLINRFYGNGLAFQPGIPPIDIFPMNKWRALFNNYWNYVKSSELSYGKASGDQVLKKQISNYLQVSRSVKCNASQIFIVSGSLQSLYLIANALLNEGDKIILEDPTFPNVHAIFKTFLATLIPIPLDNEGLAHSELEKLPTQDAKLIHVTPTNQYPTGVRMTTERKEQILSWASKNKSYVVENDFEREVSDFENSAPTMFSLDQENRTIYLGTFNRLLFPSVRLGYMVVPPHLVQVIEALQELSYRFVSPLTQLVMGQFIEKNHLYLHLKKLKDTTQKRKTFFMFHFEQMISDMYLENAPNHSLHLVAKFKQSVSVDLEKAICQELQNQGVMVFPFSKCFIEQKPQTGFILGYSTVSSNWVKQKLKTIALTLKEYLK